MTDPAVLPLLLTLLLPFLQKFASYDSNCSRIAACTHTIPTPTNTVAMLAATGKVTCLLYSTASMAHTQGMISSLAICSEPQGSGTHQQNNRTLACTGHDIMP